MFLTRPRLLHALLFSGTVASTIALSSVTPAVRAEAQTNLQDSPKAVLDQAWQIVYREYVDGSFNRVNWQEVRQELLGRNYSSREDAYRALRQALQRLNDPYTRFMDPRQYEALTSQTSGELSGVGLRLKLEEGTGAITVVEPIPNSPAARAGIQVGDRILSIDGTSTQGMSIEDASNRIRGQVGTRIVLRLQRQGRGPFDLTLTRARIELPNVFSSVKQEQGTRVGYIRLTEFSAHAAEQMQRAIQEHLRQNVDGFVLDLRGNPGGLLQASIEISRMWINNGAIVRTAERSGGRETISANNRALTNLPLVVLVDGNSASSSEILTGALMDNNRAIVVGSRTFGKALVQSVHPLMDGSGLAVTIAHYYTPNGTDISDRGITPNIVVNLSEEQRRQLYTSNAMGTRRDAQYLRALGALRTAIAAYRQSTPSATRPVTPIPEARVPDSSSIRN
ncbi:MAG TPA: PDZ domain-containing protein [Synechococcales cyanobacterium M55_K2018_004]|nr:PDZ domain-containing protein [Synechococcales cyanobacterium M55_K2018_004]